MMRWILIVASLACVALTVVDADADERRRRRDVPYYTFSPGYLEEKTAPYRDRYSQVVALKELSTVVTEGAPICRLTWTGREVHVFLGAPSDTVPVAIPLPRGANVDAVKVWYVAGDGKDAREEKKASLSLRGDSLIVGTAPGDSRVVDVQYTFKGTGITVDESFLFQPEWPVLSSRYSFSVARELWQKAADQGLKWEFTARTEPRTWRPARADSPDAYTWAWRSTNIDPLAPDDTTRVPLAVLVSGYLPAPVLARYDPEELPGIEALDEITRFERFLEQDYASQQTADYGGAGGGPGSDASSQGGQPPVLPPK
jgi:hypothetical protein